MGNLSNLYVSRSFQSLIHLATDNTASANLIGLEDGYGNPIGVSVNTTGDLSISGSFTASLQNGYVWVGNSSGKSTTVATSSFGGGGSVPAGTISGSAQITALGFVSSSVTASSLITASASATANTITFTKGDNSTFNVTLNITSSATASFDTGSFATTGSNTFIGNQTVSGYVSASNGFKVGGGATALEIGDGSNIRFLTGSSNYYNIQLVPDVGDIAFSRDGVSNTKTFTLAGSAGANTTFQNNPVQFLATVSSVAINAPLAINSGISSNVDITGSLKINAASVSTNASFPIPFISASIVSKDSVDTLVYNPSTNQLLVSASTGQSILSPSVIQFTSGSGTATYSSTINKNAFIQTSESGYVIGISGNPSKIGAPSLSANTKPAIYALSSSAVPYVAIELENSQSFTDGRVTFHRNVAMLQNLEITGSLTASLTQGYVWVGNGNNRSVLVATSSFSGGGGSTFPYTGTAEITGALNVSGSARIVGKTSITGALQVIGDGSTNITLNRGSGPIFNLASTDVGLTMGGNATFDIASNGGTTTTLKITAPTGGSTGRANINLDASDVGGNDIISISARSTNNTASLWITDANSDIPLMIFEQNPEKVTAYNQLVVSGSTIITGSVDIKGNTKLSSSFYIQSGSTLPAATGSAVLTYNPTTGQVGQASYTQLLSASFDVGGFQTNNTKSGSAGVSQSVDFEITDVSKGITMVSNTQATVQNSGTYLLIFSAQLECSAGADTVWIWLKKNGTNVPESATKSVMQNNTAQTMTVNFMLELVANDYIEVVWQNNAGNARILAEAASGNYPAIPAVILTINQIH